jgi:hypothetical protein
MRRHVDKTATFLNVDLILYSRWNLEPLVAAPGRRVCVLYTGKQRRTYEAHLELAGQPKSADAGIRGLAALIGALPEAERKLWDTARTRDFNIGVEAAMKPFTFEIPIARETGEAASAPGTRIVFTLCAPDVHGSMPAR